MKEIDLLFPALGIVWGLLIGLLYFGGLWWTLVRLPERVRPRLWLTGSYVLRLGFALLGFWLIMRESLTALFLSLAGFFIMRLILIRRLGIEPKGGGHAN
ncbi:ATP synthase subunit I [Thermodesulfobacteriota bacterium]